MKLRDGYQWQAISREEGDKIRALAILAIVVHNFLHWVDVSPGENEYYFSSERRDEFVALMATMPWDALRLIMTYFGHYGVQIFFFLSGYGIAMKYAESPPLWWSFMRRRLANLYLPIVVAAAGFVLYSLLAPWGGGTVPWLKLGLQMLGVSNFLPGNQVWLPIGPWWFIGVIVQFYCLVPILLKFGKRYGTKFYVAIILFGVVLEYVLAGWERANFDWSINYSILGHLDTCGFGMLMAVRKEKRLSWVWIGAALLVFLVGSLWGPLWVVSGLALVVGGLPMIRSGLVRCGLLSRIFGWVGGLSMYLFLCNGYLREPFIGVAREHPQALVSALMCLVFVLVSLLWALVLRLVHDVVKLLIGR